MIGYWNLGQIRQLDRKLLAFGKKRRQFTQKNKPDILILWRQWILDTNDGERTLLSRTPPATPSGVNSLLPGKVIMDIRNGMTWDVFMGYERNLLVRSPMNPEPVREILTLGDFNLTNPQRNPWKEELFTLLIIGRKLIFWELKMKLSAR